MSPNFFEETLEHFDNVTADPALRINRTLYEACQLASGAKQVPVSCLQLLTKLCFASWRLFSATL